jgi:Rhodopirellula transposase DDE domain
VSPFSRGALERLERYEDERLTYRSEGAWGQQCPRLPGNGALLDSLEAVIKSASTMTWKGKHPLVALVTTTYQTGVKLTKEAMQVVETQLQRLPDLDKWFVDIVYPSPGVRDG